MWDFEDIESRNPRILPRMLSTFSIERLIVREMASEMESWSDPNVLCFFQLPYPIALEPQWHRVKIFDDGSHARVQTRLQTIGFDENGQITHTPVDFSVAKNSDRHQFLITQCLVSIPLWGRRAQYYDQYCKCVTDTGLDDRIVIPRERSWILDRAMRASDYEVNAARRMIALIFVTLRQLLPAYSIISLCEAPMPARLAGLYVMTAPGWLTFASPPESIVRSLSPRHFPLPDTIVSHTTITNALKLQFRELAHFETQLLAMNRLRADGESVLALIGALSLAEWLVNSTFVELNTKSNKSKSLGYILYKTSLLSEVPISERDTLIEAVATRNRFVHGAPPMRASLVVHGDFAGREDYSRHEELPALAEKTIKAVFVVYRMINSLESPKLR